MLRYQPLLDVIQQRPNNIDSVEKIFNDYEVYFDFFGKLFTLTGTTLYAKETINDLTKGWGLYFFIVGEIITVCGKIGKLMYEISHQLQKQAVIKNIRQVAARPNVSLNIPIEFNEELETPFLTDGGVLKMSLKTIFAIILLAISSTVTKFVAKSYPEIEILNDTIWLAAILNFMALLMRFFLIDKPCKNLGSHRTSSINAHLNNIKNKTFEQIIHQPN